MADLPGTTNTTIWDDAQLRSVQVNTDDELLVHDQDAIDYLMAIAAGTGIISGSVTTNWEYFAQNDLAFVTSYGASFAGGTAEQAFSLLRNPAGSGYTVRIKRITFAISTNTTGTFRLYREPTITAPGTALHIENFRDVAVNGVATSYSIPTYSATGELFTRYDLNAGGTGIILIEQELALIMLEGDDLLITLAQGSNNNAFAFNISWAEEEITP